MFKLALRTNSCNLRPHFAAGITKHWYIGRKKEEEKHKCVPVPGVNNTVSNKSCCFFSSIYTTYTNLTNKKEREREKTQCSTVQRWLSVARYRFFLCYTYFFSFSFLYFIFMSWQHSGSASMCHHHKLVSLSKLLSCLRRLCRFSPPLDLLRKRKGEENSIKTDELGTMQKKKKKLPAECFC